jgi:hypothetical protein
MERMLALVNEHPLAAAVGAFGAVCVAAYPLFRARSLLLTSYLGNNLAFAAHYALLGQATGLTMNLIMGAQTLVAMGLARWPSLRWVYFAIMALLLGAAAMTWHGWVSVFSTTATALSTIGRMQSRELVLRVLLLASVPLWGAHDLLVGSLPGLLADAACGASGSWMLLRHLRLASGGPRLAPIVDSPCSSVESVPGPRGQTQVFHVEFEVPAPIGPKPCAMPPQNRVRLNHAGQPEQVRPQSAPSRRSRPCTVTIAQPHAAEASAERQCCTGDDERFSISNWRSDLNKLGTNVPGNGEWQAFLIL